MRQGNNRSEIAIAQSVAVVVAALLGLYFLGNFEPLPGRVPDAKNVVVYYGPDGETRPAPDVAPDVFDAAQEALQDAEYFGAFAVGSGGRTGLWVGARTPELARTYALALCGEGCTVAAERVPLYRYPARMEPILTYAMAQNLGIKVSAVGDVLAIGGANAWGHSSRTSGKSGRRNAMREAAADCEARRSQEALSDQMISEPCRVMSLNEIVDLRPKPTLYPAAFTLEFTEIVPVTETKVIAEPDRPSAGLFGAFLPPRLYGARAAINSTSWDEVFEAGWPVAGEAIAVLKCNAGRRPGEPPCRLTHQRLPDAAPSKGVLQVAPDLFASFQAWKDTNGAGAFAISPYGPWGFSYGMADKDAAIQKAADWCWYYTRRSWEYRKVDDAFLDAKLDFKVIAVRE